MATYTKVDKTDKGWFGIRWFYGWFSSPYTKINKS